MSRNIETVNRYLDGFRKNDHQQILSCLTDDIEWTVFGAFRLTGKEAYDKAIDGAPQFVDQFGSFQSLASRYGGAQLLKSDLELVKAHLYVPMTLN